MIITIHIRFSLQTRRFLTETQRYIDRGRHLVVLTVQDGGIALFPKKIMDRAAACFVGYVKFVLTICHKAVDSLENVK